MDAMMASLERMIDQQAEDSVERRFMTHAHRYLSTASSRQTALDHWTITSLEVDIGRVIGSGGLFVVFSFHTIMSLIQAY